MLFLLPLLISAGGGLLLWKTNIGERILSLVLSKVLNALGEHGAEVHALKHGRGISVANFRLREDIGPSLGIGIKLLELRWPTLTKPMQIHLKSAKVLIKQNALPKHISTKQYFSMVAAKAIANRLTKLRAIDECLWSSTGTLSTDEGGWMSRYINAWLHWAIYNVILLAVSLLYVHAHDIELRYTQQGQPGPNGSRKGGDGLILSVRQFKLAQIGAVVNTESGEEETVDANSMPNVIRNVSRSARDGTVPHEVDGKQLQVSVAGVNVSLESWKGNSYPKPPGAHPEEAKKGGAAPQGDDDEASTAVSNDGEDSEDETLDGDEHGAEPAQRMDLLKQWGATVVLVVSAKKFSSKDPRPQVVPVWQKDWDDAHKAAQKAAGSSDLSEAAGDAEGSGNKAKKKKKGKKWNEEKAQDDANGRRMNPAETTGWLKAILFAIKPILSGPPSKGKPLKKQAKRAKDNPAPVHLKLDVDLNAAILMLRPDTIACLLRIVKRLGCYGQFAKHWQVRPNESVSSNPVAWWQHAGRAVTQELKGRMRWQLGLKRLESRRETRLRYMELYSVLNAAHTHWQVEPNSTLFRRLTDVKATSVSAAREELSLLEEDLTLSEIASFRFMAACKHNSNLSNTFSRRVSVAQCVGAIASSPTPWSLRDDLLNFIHGVKPESAVSNYLLPDIQVRMAKVGLVLQPESTSEKVLVSMHGLTATIDNTSKINLNVESAHIGDATKHMEPGENVLLKAPMAKSLSDALSKQTNVGQAFGEHHAFLDVTFMPSEPFVESGSMMIDPEAAEAGEEAPEEPGKHHPGFRRVPRDKIDIKISGIEAAMAQEVVVRILKFGQDFNRSQEAGLVNNTDLTGYGESLQSMVRQSMHANSTPQLRPGTNPLPIIHLSCIGFMLRFSYSANPKTVFDDADVEAELGVTLPAVQATFMGMQSYESTGMGADLEKTVETGTPLWSPDLEVCVFKMLMDLSVVFRPRGSSKTLMNTISVSDSWSIPGEEKCQPGGKDEGTKEPGNLLPLLLARHMQVHVAYSMRSFPSIYSGINSVWAHNTCEGVLMWVSPYQLNELLSVVDTVMARVEKISRMLGVDTDVGRETREHKPSAQKSDEKAAADKQTGTPNNKVKLNAGISFQVNLFSLVISAIDDNDGVFQPGSSAGTSPMEKAIWRRKSLTTIPEESVKLTPTLELLITNLHGVIRAFGTEHFSYKSKVDAVMLRNLQHSAMHSSAYLLRPNLFLSTRISAAAAKTREKVKTFRPQRVSSVSRLLKLALQQVSIVNYASYGYAMPPKDTEDFVMKIAGFQYADLATITASAVFDLNSSGWDKSRNPLLNLKYIMTGVRMNLSVMTLQTVLNTMTQTLVLNSIRAQRNAALVKAGGKAKPKPQDKPAARAPAGDSGLIKALRSVKVKANVSVTGAIIDLVARDQRRVMSVILQTVGFTLDVPGKGPDGPPAPSSGRVSATSPGGLLYANFSIADMSIRDTLGRGYNCVVLRNVPGTTACTLGIDFGIHKVGKAKVKHILEVTIDNPHLMVMMRFINNILFCVNDILTGMERQQTVLEEAGGQLAPELEQPAAPEAAAGPQKPKAARGEGGHGFAVRLCIRGAKVLIPAASGSKNSLALEVQEVLVGFPAAALLPDEVPPHCSAAAGLLSDSEAVEHCYLLGPTGQISVQGGRPPLEANLSVRISHFTIYMGVLSLISKRADPRESVSPSSEGQRLHSILMQTKTAKSSIKVLESGTKIECTQTIFHPVKAVYAVLSLGSPERPGLHLHTSLPSLNISFSNKVFNGIMGFVSGNLAEQSSFGAPRAPPQRTLNTVFNPDQAFSPRVGDPPSLRITVFVSKVQVLLMAQPSIWEKSPAASSAAPRSPGTPNAKDNIAPRDVPFLRLGLENFTINMFMLKQSGNLHIDLASGRLRIDDLRFAGAAKWRRHKEKAERPNMQEGARLPVVRFSTVEINGNQVFEAATVPVVHIVRAPWEPPKEEMLHITEKVESPNVMKIRFTMQKDGTMAAEVVVSNAVAQWPFLEDLSLVNGILSILKRPPSEDGPAVVGQPTANPWFYFNFLFQKSQLVIPVINISKVTAAGTAKEMQGLPQYGNLATELVAKCCRAKSNAQVAAMVAHTLSGHATPQRMMMAQQGRMSGKITSVRSGSSTVEAEELTASGIAASMLSFRAGFSMGGDGEMKAPIGLRSCSVFVRHPHAVMKALVLPFSMTLDANMQKAEVEANRRRKAALIIQRWWRHGRHLHAAQGALRKRISTKQLSQMNADGDDSFDNTEQEIAEIFMAQANKAKSSVLSLDSFKIANILIHRILDDASRDALGQAETKAIQTVLEGPGGRNTAALMPMNIAVNFRCSKVTLRLSSTNLFIIQELLQLLSAGSPDPAAQAPADQPAPAAPETPKTPKKTPSKPAPEAIVEAKEEAFRPVVIKFNAIIDMASVVICNDRPQSYGAPDFLLVSGRRINCEMYSEQFMPNRKPDVFLQLGLESKLDFLNNSSGGWEQIMPFWPVEVSASIKGKSGSAMEYTTEMSINSDERLETTFYPAFMLSIGDILAFVGDVKQILGSRSVPDMDAWYGEGRPQVPMVPPSMQEQLALGKPLTARVPQKYLIKNLSGLTLWYWAGNSDPARATLHSLKHHSEETLQVEPSEDVNTVMALGKQSASRVHSLIINLKFQGNWMPITRLLVNHIGKYRYELVSPHDGVRVPLIVDISLKARTKIISVHSMIRVRNYADVPLRLRLHVPALDVVGPISNEHGASETLDPSPDMSRRGRRPAEAEPGGQVMTGADESPSGSVMRFDGSSIHVATTSIDLGWFKCGDEQYLPVHSVLGGSLFVAAEDCAESRRDVIHLNARITAMEKQQGSIMCERLSSLGAFHYSAIVEQTFGETLQAISQSPGNMATTQDALECEIQFQPTMQVNNSLPYPMLMVLKEGSAKLATDASPPEPEVMTSLDHHQNTTISELQSEGYTAMSVKGSYMWTSQPSGPYQQQNKEAKELPGDLQRYLLPPGSSVDVYMDPNKYIYGLCTVPALQLKTPSWVLLHAAKTKAYSEEAIRAEQRRLKALEATEVRMTKPAPTDGSIKQVHERSCLRACIQGKKRRKPQMQNPRAQSLKLRSAESQAQVPLSLQSRVEDTLGDTPDRNLVVARPEVAPDVSANQILFGEGSEQAPEHQESALGLNRSSPAGPVRLSFDPTPSGEGFIANLNVQDSVEQRTLMDDDDNDDDVELLEGASADEDALRVRLEMTIDDDGVSGVRLLVQDIGDSPSELSDSIDGDSALDTAPVRLELSVNGDDTVAAHMMIVNEANDEDGWPSVTTSGLSAVAGLVTKGNNESSRGEEGREGKLVRLDLRPTLSGVTSVKLLPEIQPAADELPVKHGSDVGSYSHSGSPASMGSSTASKGRQRRRPKAAAGPRAAQSRFRQRPRVQRRPMSEIPNFGNSFAAPDEVLTESLESVMCPSEISLQLHREDHETRTMRTITISAPYWVSNATGHHIVFADHGSAGKETWNWLCGERFTEVLVPFQSPRELNDESAMLLPSLLNVQDSSKFRLAKSNTMSGSGYTTSFGINTVGQPRTVQLTGDDSVPDHEASAGLLLYRSEGGPDGQTSTSFWVKKDESMVSQNPEEAARNSMLLARKTVTLGNLSRSSSIARADTASSAVDVRQLGLPPTVQEGNEEPERPSASPQKPSMDEAQRDAMLTLLELPPLFDMTVEVKPAPTDTMFRHTKLVEVRNKFVIENLSGMNIEVKQVGLPNIEDLEGILSEPELQRLRARRVIPTGSAQPLHRVQIPHGSESIIIRPDSGGWDWSGEYLPEDKEKYFGVRLLHRTDPDKFLILPVTVAVGKGTVLISLQSATGVPPYRLVNHCSSIQVSFCQEGISAPGFRLSDAGTRLRNRKNGRLPPGSRLDYAFDEPMLPHRLVLSTCLPGGRPQKIIVDMDRVGFNKPWMLPAGTGYEETGAPGKKDEGSKRKTELARMASRHLHKKVYLEVYADGPTRTLSISETMGYSRERQIHQIVDMATEIRQLASHLRELNRQFIGAFGSQEGANQIDMYGRALDPHGYLIGADQDELLSEPASKSTRFLRSLQSTSTSLFSSKSLTGSTSQRPAPLTPATPLAPDDKGKAPALPADEEDFDDRVLSFSVLSSPGRETAAKSSRFRGSPEKLSVAGDQEEQEPSLDLSRRGSRAGRLSVSSHHQTEGEELAAWRHHNLLEVLGVLQEPHNSDLEMLIGGELAVTAVRGFDLHGDPSTTNPFVVLRIKNEEQVSRCEFEDVNPMWNYQINFDSVVSLNMELVAEVYDYGGTEDNEELEDRAKKGKKKAKARPQADTYPEESKDTTRFHDMVRNSRFIGQAAIELSSTMGEPTQRIPLMRREADDEVNGMIELRFTWDITAKGLLTLKKRALQHVISQRSEILSLLYPADNKAIADAIRAAELNLAKGPNKMQKDGNDSDDSSVHSGATDESRIEDLLNEAKKGSLTARVLAARGLGRGKSNPLAMQFQAPSLPDTYVELKLVDNSNDDNDESFRTGTVTSNLQPSWDTGNEVKFDQASLNSVLNVTMYNKFAWAGRWHKSGGVSLAVEGIRRLANTKHAWLELKTTAAEREALGLTTETAPEVLVRLSYAEATSHLEHINHHITMDLKGFALAMMNSRSSEPSELLNTTYNKIQVDVKVSDTQADFRAAVSGLQIDNQLVSALKPVVLSPNPRNFSPKNPLEMSQLPMIKLTAIRSFQSSTAEQELEGKSESILSFKEVSLQIGEMDFQADEGLLEALLNFVLYLPIEDLSPDTSNEAGAIVKNTGEAAQDILRKLGHEYQNDVNGLRGSSGSLSWFFIEELKISTIKINTTVSVSSSLVNSTNKLVNFGTFGKYLGAAGFSLVNVSNVPLELGFLDIKSELLSVNSLVGRAIRHYVREGLSEAHKVMGGSGPGLAGLPLTVVWAFGSVWDIGAGLRSSEIGLLAALQKGGFVIFTATGQMIGAVSKTAGSVLIWTPPYRDDARSDTAAMTRYIMRPSHAPEALWKSIQEPIFGIMSGVIGLALDPLAGSINNGPVGMLYGTGKGVLGLFLRPIAGILEGGAKFFEGAGLLCLGNAGLTGLTTTRMRAPGTLHASNESTRASYQEVNAREQLLNSWHMSLVAMLPRCKHDKVVDVIAYDIERVIIITNHRIVWLQSWVQREGVTNWSLHGCLAAFGQHSLKTEPDSEGTVLKYRITKHVKLTKVQSVTGRAERQTVTVHYLIRLGNLKVNIPAVITFHCRTGDIYTKVIYVIHHQNRKQGIRNKRTFEQFDCERSTWAIFRTPVPPAPGPNAVAIEKVAHWQDTDDAEAAAAAAAQDDNRQDVQHDEVPAEPLDAPLHSTAAVMEEAPELVPAPPALS